MRTDCHVHLDPIGAPHHTPAPAPQELLAYARRESIDLFGAIYEEEATLERMALPGVRLFPFYWERTPSRPRIPESAAGIKLHPFIDRYRLEEGAIRPTLETAAARSLPLLIHSEDRTPELSRGRHFARLAASFPELTFILAHAGSYSPGIVEQPGATSIDERLTRELVDEAIDAALAHRNLYLEVCILASRVKTEALVRRAPRERLLIGSDFPICKEHFGSAVFQENQLREAGMTWAEIEQLHENARRLLS